MLWAVFYNFGKHYAFYASVAIFFCDTHYHYAHRFYFGLVVKKFDQLDGTEAAVYFFEHFGIIRNARQNTDGAVFYLGQQNEVGNHQGL